MIQKLEGVRGTEKKTGDKEEERDKRKERELISLALPAKSFSIHRTDLLCDSHCVLTDSEW